MAVPRGVEPLRSVRQTDILPLNDGTMENMFILALEVAVRTSLRLGVNILKLRV